MEKVQKRDEAEEEGMVADPSVKGSDHNVERSPYVNSELRPITHHLFFSSSSSSSSSPGCFLRGG